MNRLWISLSVGLLLCVFAPRQGLLAQEQTDAGTNPSSIRITEQPQLLVSVLPDSALDGIYEQSQILLTIRVASKHPFDALTIDFPAIANAEQIELAAPRTRKIKSYAGEGYMHERRYAVFPLAAGNLEIPASFATGLIDTPAAGQVEFNATHDGMRIPVLSTPAGFSVDWWLVSSNVVMEESWSIPVDELRQGDVVTRTVTLRAAGVDDKRLPDLEHGSTRGIAVRELESTRKSIVTKNGLDGIVSASWALRIDGDGFVYVPPMGIAYWDPLAKTRKTVAVRGHRIEPLPVDSEARAEQLLYEAATTQRTAYHVFTTLLIMLVLPVFALVLYALATVFCVLRDRRFSHQFLKADKPITAYRAWQRWSAGEQLANDDHWRVLNRDVQAAVFAAPEMPVLDKRKVLRDALRCARRQRLQGIGAKLSVFIDRVIGSRAELAPARAAR